MTLTEQAELDLHQAGTNLAYFQRFVDHMKMDTERTQDIRRELKKSIEALREVEKLMETK